MNKPEKITMGKMISALRRERGMTQAELAEKMSVTDKAVSKWERDLCCPDIGTLPRLAELFSVSVDDLMHARAIASTAPPASAAHIVRLVLKAIPLAMGVAVVILSSLRQLEPMTGVKLLGIGLLCLALGGLMDDKN